MNFEWLILQATELTNSPLLSASTPSATEDHSAVGISDGDAIRVTYGSLTNAGVPLGLLAAVSFGSAINAPPVSGDALHVRVRLDPLHETAPAELWWANGPVTRGQTGMVRYSHDEHHLFAVIELDEREHGGIESAAAAAYSSLQQFQQQSPFPHLLRVWNYMDAINEGAGDLERYRHFCVGRAHGMGHTVSDKYPAATAIGQQQRTHQLQVYWLAGRMPGTQIENPRQVSAYRYPRAHGPVSPSFARATLSPDGTLLISGTASIVGHVSQHGDDFVAQLDETLRNLSTLKNYADNAAPEKQQGTQQTTHAPTAAHGLYKVYVRDRAHIEEIAAHLQQNPPRHFDPGNVIYLAADICRRELLLEIECLRFPARA